jgi:hypothetical protein
MLSPPVLLEYCKIFATSLEAQRISNDCDVHCSGMSFGMPINIKNTSPQNYNYYLAIGDSIAK